VTGNDPTCSSSGLSVDGWTRSSFCGPNGGDCLEVNGSVAGQVGLRDSKQCRGPFLIFNARGWGEFVSAVRRDEFDHMTLA
jgi:Domain of unknown function (DUF397)